MSVGYTTVTFDVQRDPEIDDAYGGEAPSAQVIYSRLTGILSYPSARTVARFEGGPGLATRTRGVMIMEPKPENVMIEADDRLLIEGGGTWKVVGVRDRYEKTLQLDLELRT